MSVLFGSLENVQPSSRKKKFQRDDNELPKADDEYRFI